MAAFKDITGQRFGRWTVLRFDKTQQRAAYWLCRCDCGTEMIAAVRNLIRGRSKSCGCYRREASRVNNRTHGHTIGYRPGPEYQSWRHAKERCFNPNADNFERYGGRGITMCRKWSDSFAAFFEDMGHRPEGTEIDRIDNDGNYEPGNCRWAPRKVQIRNTSVVRKITHNGETLTLSEWSERTGIKLRTLHSRLHRGLPLFDPVPNSRNHLKP